MEKLPEREDSLESHVKEILEQYKDHQQYFINHNSDLICLELCQNHLIAKQTFKPYELIMEVRGQIYHHNQVIKLCQQQTAIQPNFMFQEMLLKLDEQGKYLIKPTNASRYLTVTAKEPDTSKDTIFNCELQRKHNSKLFVTSTDIIVKGDRLKLKYQDFLFSYP